MSRPYLLVPTEREWLIIMAAMSLLRGNLEDVNIAFDLSDEGRTITIAGKQVPAFTEEEVVKLHEAILQSPMFQKIPVESGTYEPAHLIGLLNGYNRQLPSENRYGEAYSIPGGRLVYARLEPWREAWKKIWHAYFVSEDNGVFPVSIGKSAVDPLPPNVGDTDG